MKRYLKKIVPVIGAFSLLLAAPAGAQFFAFENPLVGEVAPDFSANTLRSGYSKMSEFRDGESAIIFFWATWCPHCRKQLSELDKESKALDQKGIKVILVDLQEPLKLVESYMKKNKLDFEVFFDADQSIAEKYAIVGVPTFIFIDKDGIVRAVEHEIPPNYEQILSGR